MRAGATVVLVAVIVALVAAGLIATARGRAGTSEVAARGRALYGSSCASCHGVDGEGAPNWKTADPNGAFPPPPHNGNGHTWHHADELLFRIVRDGCGAYSTGDIPCNMPAFDDRLSDDDIRAILAFIREWWADDQRAFQARVSAEDQDP